MANVDVSEIMSRLRWGQPAFTIIDMRDRYTFNQGHIMGALPMSMKELANHARKSLQTQREIYIYGESDEQTADAARKLQAIRFGKMAGIAGDLAAWKDFGGAIEGLAA